MSEKKQRKVKAQVPVPGEALRSCGSLQPLPRGFNPQPRAGAGRCNTRTSPSKNTDGQQRSLNPGGKWDGNLAQGGPRGGQGRHVMTHQAGGGLGHRSCCAGEHKLSGAAAAHGEPPGARSRQLQAAATAPQRHPCCAARGCRGLQPCWGAGGWQGTRSALGAGC